MKGTLKGRAHVYGDDIDTDRIIAGKYTKTLDLSQLAEHVLEEDEAAGMITDLAYNLAKSTYRL